MKRASIRTIKKFYDHLDATDQPARLIRPEDGLGDWRQIVTIRHAKPDQERELRFTAAQAQAYLKEYDEVPIVPFEHPSFLLKPGELPQVYASTLPRAYQTARALFGPDMRIEQNALFIELEREVPQLFGERKLHRRVWPLIYRGQYFLNKNYETIESFPKARQRIRKSADFLTEASFRDGAAVLVAHGLFNFFLKFSLKARGWKRVRRSGRAYLGVSIYVYVGDK